MSVKVLIVIPVKNRAHLLAETIQSVVNQTFSDWEAIIIDDGSSEAELAQIKKIAGANSRIHLMARSGRRRGASACRNLGLEAGAGKYVIFLDSDDVLAPFCLKNRVAFMEKNPALDFAVFQTWKLGDAKCYWNTFKTENDLDRFLRSDGAWTTQGPIWRRASLMQAGLRWDERALCCQDWSFHIRAMSAGLKHVCVPQADSSWRVTQNGSISNRWNSLRYSFNRARTYASVAEHLRQHDGLSCQRMRIFAALFYGEAFGPRHPRRRSQQIWRLALRSKVVGRGKYFLTLMWKFGMWLAVRLNACLEPLFFPEYCRVGSSTLFRTDKLTSK